MTQVNQASLVQLRLSSNDVDTNPFRHFLSLPQSVCVTGPCSDATHTCFQLSTSLRTTFGASHRHTDGRSVGTSVPSLTGFQLPTSLRTPSNALEIARTNEAHRSSVCGHFELPRIVYQLHVAQLHLAHNSGLLQPCRSQCA